MPRSRCRPRCRFPPRNDSRNPAALPAQLLLRAAGPLPFEPTTQFTFPGHAARVRMTASDPHVGAAPPHCQFQYSMGPPGGRAAAAAAGHAADDTGSTGAGAGFTLPVHGPTIWVYKYNTNLNTRRGIDKFQRAYQQISLEVWNDGLLLLFSCVLTAIFCTVSWPSWVVLCGRGGGESLTATTA